MIYHLLCFYAFFVPLERILKIFFGIDTILKPYRVVGLLIIGFFTIQQVQKIQIKKEIREDIFLYALYGYGIFISLWQMIFSPFSMGKFYSDLFQISIYIVIFFIIKNLNLNRKQLITIFSFFAVGVVCNIFFASNRFVFLGKHGRQEGFMDNPNYLALATIVLIPFFLITFKYVRPWLKLIYILLTPITLIVFTTAGSRTGFAIGIVLFLILFLMQSFGKKVLLSIGAGLVILLASQLYGGGQSAVKTPLIVLQRIENAEVSDNPRFTLWKGAMRAAESTHYLGLGIGQFKARFSEFYTGENNRVVREVVEFGYHLTPHSDYFAILSTYGLIGLICYLLFLYFSMRKMLLRSRNINLPWHKNLHQYQILLLLSLIVFGIASDSFNNAMYWFILSVATKADFEE